MVCGESSSLSNHCAHARATFLSICPGVEKNVFTTISFRADRRGAGATRRTTALGWTGASAEVATTTRTFLDTRFFPRVSVVFLLWGDTARPEDPPRSYTVGACSPGVGAGGERKSCSSYRASTVKSWAGERRSSMADLAATSAGRLELCSPRCTFAIRPYGTDGSACSLGNLQRLSQHPPCTAPPLREPANDVFPTEARPRTSCAHRVAECSGCLAGWGAVRRSRPAWRRPPQRRPVPSLEKS